jgi:hypothetical protein
MIDIAQTTHEVLVRFFMAASVSAFNPTCESRSLK